ETEVSTESLGHLYALVKPDAALTTALACRGAGICTIPVWADGSKSPAVPTWDPYKVRLPTERELHPWFGNGSALGVAVVCGAVSGNLCVLDFEFLDFFRAWCELVDADFPGLVESLPQIKTPGKTADGGRHLYARGPEPVPTGKLARLTAEEAKDRTGD